MVTGIPSLLGKEGQFLRGIGGDDPTSDIEDGLLRLHDQVDGPLDLAGMAFVGRLVSADEDLFRIFEFGGIDHDIFGKVDQDRSRSSASGDVEGLFHDLGQDLSHLLPGSYAWCRAV